ncbi:DUF3999 family protein [bacterium SCSIO 12741]|nr:DUF3999 family protein [bacterium SCSIO 12741]
MNKTVIASLIGVLWIGLTHAQMEKYTYKRALANLDKGWNEVELPPEIFKNLNSHWSDIRIYGINAAGDTVEAPYLFREKKEEGKLDRISFKELNATTREGSQYLTLSMPDSLEVNQLQLNLSENNFDARVDVEGSQDQKEWYSIVQDQRILAIQNDQTRYRYTTLKFPTAKYRFLRLRIQGMKPTEVRVEAFKAGSESGKYWNFEPQSITSSSAEGKRSLLEFDLDEEYPISFIQLGAYEDYDFHRKVTIKCLRDSIKTEKGWKYRYRNLTAGVLSSLEENRYEFPMQVTGRVQVLVENRDNAPLTLQVKRVGSHVNTLITRIDQPADYFLVYGWSKASSPSYDIAHFSDTVSEVKEQIGVGEEQVQPKEEKEQLNPLITDQKWLWAVMILVILILGGLTLKMIQNPK